MIVAIIATSCKETKSNNGTSYTIDGTVADSTLTSTYAYLRILPSEEVIDSTLITNGKFLFSGTIETAQLALIIADNYYMDFVLEPGNISIELDNPGKVTGAELNNALSDLKEKIEAIKSDAMNKLYSSETTESPEDIEEAYFTAMEDLLSKTFDKNRNNIIGAVAISSWGLEGKELDSILNLAGPIVIESPWVTPLIEQQEKTRKTAEGEMFTDFTIEQPNGQKVSLSDYVGKGKYVLVDFWASWCGPCRAEIPNIKELYHKYTGNRFEVLGVAVWDKVEDTQKAIKEEGIEWAQILNAQSIPTDIYGINGIPYIILFGPDGSIVARNLRGQEMKDTVAKVMAE